MDRFWSKVDINPHHCWEWQRALSSSGYGNFSFRGKFQGAHRVSYILTYGCIPTDLRVLHICDNRKCVRPDHLWLGTQAENIQDMYAKGRGVDNTGKGPSRCKRGHLLSETRNSSGNCRPCTNERQRNYNANKKVRRRH